MIRLYPIMLTVSSLLLLMTHLGYSETIRNDHMSLISDGSDSELKLIEMNLRENTPITCEPLYGFLPCTTNIWGHLFMIVVYQYLLAQGEMYVSSASIRFIKIHGPGSILGGSLFQLLPIIPQLFLVMASGLSASKEMAELQAAMGMQLLAGSAVMMLTLVWGACVAFGSYDIQDHSNSSNSTPNSYKYFGLMADLKSRWIARIMLVSLIPLVILQLTKLMNTTFGTRIIVLVALIVTLSFLIIHIIYQVTEPWILIWRFKILLHKYVNEKVITHLSTKDGMPDEEAIEGIFNNADENNDKMLTKAELRNFLRGSLRLGEYDQLMGIDDYVENTMRILDRKPDGKITKDEFIHAISDMIKKARETEQDHQQSDESSRSRSSLSYGSLVAEYLKAGFELILGAAIAIVLATPYLLTVMNFSTAANISQMWVPYVVIPFAMNFRMALAFVTMARQKILMLPKIYGVVSLSSSASLATFLALVYARDLTWDVSAEVLVVLIICTTMGLIASFFEKLPFWISFVAILLYPISLSLLYVFTIVLGWS